MKKTGFTLIELMIVLAILGLVSALVLPNFLKKSASKQRKTCIEQLNGLLHIAWQQSVTRSLPHKIVFDFEKKSITLHQGIISDSKGEYEYKPFKATHLSTFMQLPVEIRIKHFIVDGFDEMSRFIGGTTTESWFFINNHGIAQQITIVLTQQDMPGTEFIYDVHPFTGQLVERV